MLRWDTSDPLARMPGSETERGESKRANEWFFRFASLGVPRPGYRAWHAALVSDYETQVSQLAASGQPIGAGSAQNPPKPPTLLTIKTWSARFAWVDRLEAWDALERARQIQADQMARDRDREIRISTLQAFRGQLIKSIGKLKPDEGDPATWREITNGLRVVIPELRKEYGDDIERVEIDHRGEMKQKHGADFSELNGEQLDLLIANLGGAVYGSTDTPTKSNAGDGVAGKTPATK